MTKIKPGTSAYQQFSRLPFREQVGVTWEILRLQSQILFSNRFLLLILLVIGYFIFQYIINYNEQMIDRYTQIDILAVLLEVPLTLLAIFLNMQVIANEKDNRTLEVMLTTAGSRYKVWILRLATLNLLVLLLSFCLSFIAFYTFAEIAIFATAIHGFIPVFFVGNLTLYFAVKFRSGFAAGMISLGFVLFTMMLGDALYETRYFLYFNPFDIPRRLDPETWNRWMWQNRICVFLLGGFLQFLALRGMENRERILR